MWSEWADSLEITFRYLCKNRLLIFCVDIVLSPNLRPREFGTRTSSGQAGFTPVLCNTLCPAGYCWAWTRNENTDTPRPFPTPWAAPPHVSFLLGCAVGIAPEIYYIGTPKAIDCLSRLTPETL